MKQDFQGILIMSDLDGTFLDRSSKPVARNLCAIERFCAGGGLFSFATGRVHTTIEQFVLPNYREMINCPAIMCNGVTVYDPFSETLLFEERLDGEKIRPIVTKLFETGRFSTNFYTGTDYFCNQNIHPADIASDHWNKAVFYGDPADVDIGYAMIEAEGNHDYRFFRSSPRILEILPKNAGKGPMLRNLKQWYAGRGMQVTTVGVGDYENDLDLLAQADVAVCPDNAIEPIKAIADRVLCDNDHGVIADVIEAIERGELI